MYTSTRTLLLASLVVILAAPPALPVANGQEAVLEEIIVTARKREESLMETPLTITAFTAEDLQVTGIDELAQIVDFTPGLFYTDFGVGRGHREHRRLVFRGMQPRTDRQTRQGSTVFIDGAPSLGSELGAFENYERIEIIKGPQSAYFGRSTFSGAINAVTKTPGNEWGGRVSAEAGSFGTSRFRVEVEGPLVADKLAIRASGSTYNKDGEYKNQANPSQDFGARSTDDVAFTLYATPTENFSAKLRGHFWTDKDGPDIAIAYGVENASSLFNCQPGGMARFPDGPQTVNWICGVPPQPNKALFTRDNVLTPRLQSDFFSPAMDSAAVIDQVPFGFGLERHAQELTLVLDYEFANGITIQSITAAHEDEYGTLSDVDRRATAGLTGFLFGFPASADSYQMLLTDLEDFHQEIRIASSGEQRLRWMIGATYSERKARSTRYNKLIGGTPSPATSFAFFKPETSAVFGSAVFDISDQFTLSVEARYQEDDITEGTTPGDGSGPGNSLSGTFDSFTPRIILDYKPTPDTTIYATYAEGTNPGQFNPDLVGRSQNELEQIREQANGGIEVPEEQLTNYEFGIKSTLWDGRAQVSAAAYFGDWDSIPIAQVAFIINDAGATEQVQVNSGGGKADIAGLELQGTVLLTDKLALDASFALNKSEIITYNASELAAITGTASIDGLGKEWSRYPETSGTLSLTYRDQATANYYWFMRGDYIYTGSKWMSEANITETGDSNKVNLRVGLESDRWRIEAYGTNLFDDDTFTELQALFDLTGIAGRIGARVLTAGLAPRRSFGLRVNFNF